MKTPYTPATATAHAKNVEDYAEFLRVAKERRTQALELRRAGKKFREIAEVLQVSTARARQLVLQAEQEAGDGG